MNYRLLIIISLCVLFSCGDSSKSANENEKKEERTPMTITFYYENGADSVFLGDPTNMVIKIKNNSYDSLSLIIGKTDGKQLLDTLGIIPVRDNVAQFVFVPNKLGENFVEGVVKEFNVQPTETIIVTVPFKTSYTVIEPPKRS